MEDLARSSAPKALSPAPNGETLSARLAHWVQQTPDRTAVFDEARSLSWRELDDCATRIASTILDVPEAATQPGRVLLLFRDRISTVGALVGVVRSGNTLVVLDAGDPDERLRFIAADAEPTLILTQGSLLARARSIVPRHCRVVDVESPSSTVPRVVHRMPVVDPESIAYICYRSGSTGQPKGVCQTHVAQLFLVDRHADVVAITQTDRAWLLHSIAFAWGLATVARSISCGISLGMYDIKKDGIAGLADWLDHERITILQMVPTGFREFDAQLAPGRVLPHLRQLHMSGEAMFAEDCLRAQQRIGASCRIAHPVGATEISVVANYLVELGVVLSPGSMVPVGAPVDGVRIGTRRDDGSPAPVGEMGEIVAFSRYVSPGYWKRPELDARAFVVDPLDRRGRGYRMRDYGYLDDAGRLHFVGRVGTRVKVRGHTVDLGEVDAALLAWPDTAAAAVTAEPDPDDSLQMKLVA